jgi:hypothetical protein
MLTNEKITKDSDAITAQLERIANALERIAAALEPNHKAWTTEKEDSANLHAILYQLVTGHGGLQ